MRTQDEFVAARKRLWEELDALLMGDKELYRLHPGSISRAASLYRIVCADLMHSRAVGYTTDLVSYLDGMAARAHNALYGSRPYRLRSVWDLIARDFPRTLRRRWKFFALAWALFLLPLAVGLFGALYSQEFAEGVLPPEQLAGMAEMYSEGFEAGRDEGTDASMAGFYVWNNVGIAFRCFATGILWGLGSLFFLIYNGLLIGTTTGWVMRSGFGHNILTFMCGHGPFELTAIIISGAAGLQMGYALVETRGMTRVGSLRSQAHELGHLIVGAAVMLVIAAFIEGFWSPSSIPPPIKWTASAVFSLLVTAYLMFAGRWERARPQARSANGTAESGGGHDGGPSGGPGPLSAGSLAAGQASMSSAGMSMAGISVVGASSPEASSQQSMTGGRL